MKFKTSTCFLILSFLVLQFLSGFSALQAQNLKAHNGTVKDSYNYWFYTPAAQASEGSISIPEELACGKKPLVIFLHGASLCGRNLEKVRRYGTIDALDRGLKLDAYVLAPQNPGGAWQPSKINRIVDWAVGKYDIDTTRIYVLGMSLGGYGTIDYSAASPERVAASMALCGGGTSRKLANLCQVPMAIFHGTGDRAVPWQASQRVVDAMVTAGDTSRLIYQLIPKASHGALARYLYSPDTYNWLFEHSLSDEGRPVNQRYYFGIDALSNVYRRLKNPIQNVAVEYEHPVEAPLVCDNPNANDSVMTHDGKLISRTDSVLVVDVPAVTSRYNGIHKVRKGDTLGRIAAQHHTTIAKLCKLNHLTRTSTLQIGQKIKY